MTLLAYLRELGEWAQMNQPDQSGWYWWVEIQPEGIVIIGTQDDADAPQKQMGVPWHEVERIAATDRNELISIALVGQDTRLDMGDMASACFH